MNKEQAFRDINDTQNAYVKELIRVIKKEQNPTKIINFTSPTGTGKTKMMSLLINKLSDCFFIVTTLSKGQLNVQVEENLKNDCKKGNFIVYGSQEYKINSVLKDNDILSLIPKETKCIWIRDEGHIGTNRFEELLTDKCYRIINFSATNKNSDAYNDIHCNFAHTMMLRTVNQQSGTIEDAINKLIEVKKIHKKVKGYNPCAIFRITSGAEKLHNEIVKQCNKNNLKYIDLNEDEYSMMELCNDDNENDVIINKYKLVEGIDIKRAHVLFMDNQPKNEATTIQAIGRCRRNALLYRDDIDILNNKNQKLLKETRQCFIFYNSKNYSIEQDEDGELQTELCDKVSVEYLKPNIEIEVINGQMSNGLYIVELENLTGAFHVVKDRKTGFNVIREDIPFYHKESVRIEFEQPEYFCFKDFKIEKEKIKLFPTFNKDNKQYYKILKTFNTEDDFVYSKESINEIKNFFLYWNDEKILSKYKNRCLDKVYENNISINKKAINKKINEFLDKNKSSHSDYCDFLFTLNEFCIKIKGFDYKLEEVCDEKELLLLKSNLIKEDFISDRENAIYYIESFIDFKTEIKKEERISIIRKRFDFYDDFDEIDINNFINEYGVNNKQKDIQFCSFLEENLINSYSSTYSIFFNKNERYLIAFLCIKAKENISIEEIKEKISEISMDFYLNNLFKKGSYNKPFYAYLLNFCDEYYEEYFAFNFCINRLGEDKTEISRKEAKIFLKYFTKCLNNVFFNSYADVLNIYRETFKRITVQIKKSKAYVDYDFSNFFIPLSSKDEPTHYKNKVPVEKIEIKNKTRFLPYSKIINDKYSAIIGTDLMRSIKVNNAPVWFEASAVTHKIGKYNKLNRFISTVYGEALSQAKEQCFSGKNNFELNKRLNSMIGYVVEYYSKYLVYGKDYLGNYLEKGKQEFQTQRLSEEVVIYACILKYKEEMKNSFGNKAGNNIYNISYEQFLKGNYSTFIENVSQLAKKVSKYVKEKLYNNEIPVNNIDPNLSIKHITALADYITEDTILDIKVRNNIDEQCVRQILAYHYLSTKRTDLNIKKLIIYDATSGKDVVINLSSELVKRVKRF